MPDNPPPTRPSRALRFLVIFASIIFALCIGEIALRIVGYTYPLFYTTDTARVGWYLLIEAHK